MIVADYLIPLAIISFLIFINGIFVAAEFAIVSVPRTRIAQLAEEGSATARHVLAILNDPNLQNRYITTSQVGITIASLALGMYGEHTIAEWLLPPLEHWGKLAEPIAHSAATVLSIAILTYLHVVGGEMIPKSLGLQSAEPTALGLDRIMRFFEKLFGPFVWLLNILGNSIVRLFGIPPVATESRLMTADELEFIVDESSEGGLLEPSEQLFIANILDLQDRTVEQVMTPRTQVVAISSAASEEDVMQIVCETRISRYPIFNETIDQIIGILHIKDFARHRVRPNTKKLTLSDLARPTLFIPKSLALEKIFQQLRKENLQIAVVIDEYGGTAGIVTMEDLIEEVVGEILDEFDREIPPIEAISEYVLRVRGDLILDELEQLHDLDLLHDDAYTVGGLVMSLLGRIPEEGDTMEYHNIMLEVETVNKLAVQSVLIKRPPPANAAEHPEK